MKTNYQKIEKIVAVICNYYNFDKKLLEQKTRKVPAPFIRKMIAYQMNKHTNISQTELSKYFGQKNHSNISIGIQHIIETLDADKKIAQQEIDISRIIQEKKLSKKSFAKKTWYEFLDMNNFILAKSSTGQEILFNKMSVSEVRQFLPEDSTWEITEHKNTNKFYYKRN